MLTLYRPFSNLFRDDFANQWDSLFFGGPLSRPAQSFSPAVDVIEQEKAYLVRAELPGIAPNDVEIQVENDVLTLRGERKNEHEDERQGYRRVERSYGSFSRSFVLPKGTNVDAIEARTENGVLTISIPKVAAPAPRKVEIRTEGLAEKAKKLFTKSDEPAATA
ncbi:MAG TPA: Hsp20/alpha crystallin family protein [Polyangiaceae bacterium]|nr:Hsp20/alpha crystallin family protein [Polyangiaceae bacterium]